MVDFPIDHELFIALTGMRSGDHGTWAVDSNGIRSTLQAGGNTVHDELLRIRIAKDTAVTWPVMASRLLRWQEMTVRILPEWVECVVGSSSLDEAVDVLQQEYGCLQAEKDTAALGILRAKQGVGKPRPVLLFVADQKFNDVLRRAHAVELILELVTSGDSAAPRADAKAATRRHASSTAQKSPSEAAIARWEKRDPTVNWLVAERLANPAGSVANFLRIRLDEIRNKAKLTGVPLVGSDESVMRTARGWLKKSME